MFPTLGHEVASWIMDNVIIPDGERMGDPYILTDEQYLHLLHTYRLVPNARDGEGSDAFQFNGALLVRPQKWGKDPFAAALICAEALGPTRFAGWNAEGDPVGRPWATPWIQCAGNAEEQTGNTFRPLLAMLREGPLVSTAGLDPGETRVNLPGGGRIEPVTSSSRARQGARVTFVSLTESQLMTETSGGLKLARTLKRNLGGMDGRWIEISNAWDPAERSVAQQTFEAKDAHVYVDYRPPRSRIDLHNDPDLMAELAYIYGDSAVERGGWVRLSRIKKEIQNPAHSEGEVRRYYLNEITVGSRDAVDMLKWAAQADPSAALVPGERVALGFHGTQSKDATSLCASRLSDGCLFHLRTWDKPFEAGQGWRIPRHEVREAVADAFNAYDVVVMMASPHGWQDQVDEWAGEYDSSGDAKVLEIWLNSEMRMDQLVERFMTAHRGDEIVHDGSDILTRHASGAALADGKRRPTAEEREPGRPENYQRVVKKSWAQSISAFVAALLAYEARGWAIEHGHLAEELIPSVW
jgi:hypothetical protein